MKRSLMFLAVTLLLGLSAMSLAQSDSGSGSGGGQMSMTLSNLAEMFDSITKPQWALHEKQGFLKLSDLTEAQRDALPIQFSFTGGEGSFSAQFNYNGKVLNIREGEGAGSGAASVSGGMSGGGSFSGGGGMSMSGGTGDLEKLFDSITDQQWALHEKQGYLKLSDFTDAQRENLPMHVSSTGGGNFTAQFNWNGKVLNIREGEGGGNFVSGSGGGSMSFSGGAKVNLFELFKSITPAQWRLHERHGYLKASDLNDAQRKMLHLSGTYTSKTTGRPSPGVSGSVSASASASFRVQVNGKQLNIRIDSADMASSHPHK